ncbi:hypothetical protein AU196_06820 [Mycobacterium sp. IS-1742]|uniref:nuclear transport factor 2 family protein n=1 Tax=Mycobacterium sp. IS-1742 TaxID=1772285 RepID=UPI00073FF147|nr:nuclear transport factor 2 family protein [Mycobacterium sp. IS-1742]KUI25131.1 hypothetical protein AU196_06820 [Mycobacterium sp. IS-1742]
MRLSRLEDERDIARLVASYGPCVDAAHAVGAAELWAVDGSYDVEGWRMSGRDEVRAMVESDGHRALVAAGCCHFLGPSIVTVDGDEAVALCESVVLRAADEAATGYMVWRAAANHFHLRRGADGWRIVARTTRLLDGNPEAHRLLTAGVAGERLDPS